MREANILIVDDHDLILNGIKDMLRPVMGLYIVGKANNGEQAVDRAMSLKPDVIFMDISMPVLNGIEATKIIIEKLPDTKIIALTQHEESEYVIQFLKAGGCGYLLKNSSKDDFIRAIDTVCEGGKYVSEKISGQLITGMLYDDSAKKKSDQVILTKREREIIQKIADDMSNQQIADELHISLRTVETHRRNIMQKLKVNTVVALLKFATKHKIISFD